MENEENQNQVSLRFPPPLEIAPRFPQSHNPDDDSLLAKTQNQKARKEPQRLKKPQPPSSGSSFDEKMLTTHQRLVQYKMSLKGRAIPIQDEPDGDPLGGQEQSSCGRWESPCSKPNR